MYKDMILDAPIKTQREYDIHDVAKWEIKLNDFTFKSVWIAAVCLKTWN